VLCYSNGLVSVFEVGIGFRHFSVFLKVGLVFGIGILKYRDIDVGIRYFFTFQLFEVRSLCKPPPPTV